MSLVCDSGRVLALSALGLWMTALYAAGWSVVDLVHGGQLEPWANLLALLAAALLAAATFLVRAQVPGGLPLAASGLLALQALAAAAHGAGELLEVHLERAQHLVVEALRSFNVVRSNHRVKQHFTLSGSGYLSNAYDPHLGPRSGSYRINS